MRFRLAGFPVEIHPSFFILAVLLGLGAGDVRLILLWVAVVFVSILTHELGHAIVGRSYGLQPQIRLYSMGGGDVVELRPRSDAAPEHPR